VCSPRSMSYRESSWRQPLFPRCAGETGISAETGGQKKSNEIPPFQLCRRMTIGPRRQGRASVLFSAATGGRHPAVWCQPPHFPKSAHLLSRLGTLLLRRTLINFPSHSPGAGPHVFAPHWAAKTPWEHAWLSSSDRLNSWPIARRPPLRVKFFWSPITASSPP
jgi:hypothetical protein